MKTTFKLNAESTMVNQVMDFELDYELLRDCRRVAQALMNSTTIREDLRQWIAGMKLAVTYECLLNTSDCAWWPKFHAERHYPAATTLSLPGTKDYTAELYEIFRPFVKCSREYYLSQAYFALVNGDRHTVTPLMHRRIDNALRRYAVFYTKNDRVKANITVEEVARILAVMTMEVLKDDEA